MSFTCPSRQVLDILGAKWTTLYQAHVEYSLTALGESLMPIVDHMKAWADANMAEVEWHRRAAES